MVGSSWPDFVLQKYIRITYFPFPVFDTFRILHSYFSNISFYHKKLLEWNFNYRQETIQKVSEIELRILNYNESYILRGTRLIKLSLADISQTASSIFYKLYIRNNLITIYITINQAHIKKTALKLLLNSIIILIYRQIGDSDTKGWANLNSPQSVTTFILFHSFFFTLVVLFYSSFHPFQHFLYTYLYTYLFSTIILALLVLLSLYKCNFLHAQF